MAGFDELVAEGAEVPVDGWDFSWFAGRATEERPPWGYARMLGERMAALAGVPGAAALDLQTGGGEVLATIPAGPPALVATESWVTDRTGGVVPTELARVRQARTPAAAPRRPRPAPCTRGLCSRSSAVPGASSATRPRFVPRLRRTYTGFGTLPVTKCPLCPHQIRYN